MTHADKLAYTAVRCRVLRLTDNAVLLDTTTPADHDQRLNWIPLSLIRGTDERLLSIGDTVTIHIVDWKAQQL